MLALKIGICEDVFEDAKRLKGLINQYNQPVEIRIYPNGEALLNAFRPNEYDLIFLDIYMTGALGIDIAKDIRKRDQEVLIAFTTSSTDHTLESYRLDAVKYIEKPVTIEPVIAVLDLAYMKKQAKAHITLTINRVKKEIPLDQILYFEQQNHRIQLQTPSEKITISSSHRLNAIDSFLPESFIRCHHSFIANLQYVKRIDTDLRTFTMTNGDSVYIRRQDLKKARDAFEDYLYAKVRGV